MYGCKRSLREDSFRPIVPVAPCSRWELLACWQQASVTPPLRSIKFVMDVFFLSSSVESGTHQFASTAIVNNVLAIDAGCLGFAAIERQAQVQSIFLTHSHLDHIATLPLFLDTVYQPGPTCPTVYAGEDVIAALKTHFFNDVIWPDLIRLGKDESPFVRFESLTDRQPVSTHGLTITPVALNHVVPTWGFLIDDGHAAIAWICDTAPADVIGDMIASHPRIQAVFLECAFPRSMQWLADKAQHLTPTTFSREFSKMHRLPAIFAVHLKPAFVEQITAELTASEIPGLQIAQPNTMYQF